MCDKLNYGIEKNVQCTRCLKETDCLWCDSSDGEYGDVSLCEVCVMELFEQYKHRREKEVVKE